MKVKFLLLKQKFNENDLLSAELAELICDSSANLNIGTVVCDMADGEKIYVAEEGGICGRPLMVLYANDEIYGSAAYAALQELQNRGIIEIL